MMRHLKCLKMLNTCSPDKRELAKIKTMNNATSQIEWICYGPIVHPAHFKKNWFVLAGFKANQPDY